MGKLDPCGTPHIMSNSSVFSKFLYLFLSLLSFSILLQLLSLLQYQIHCIRFAR